MSIKLLISGTFIRKVKSFGGQFLSEVGWNIVSREKRETMSDEYYDEDGK